ncbi:MAG TPA: autotransporter-associated beta strand repeat-containing protein [Candidatus Acidoferrales bacterium]|nr:autotransporter-associated beta strand repeat-containing protein [Candidatus Acidoferrales bacterium]
MKSGTTWNLVRGFLRSVALGVCFSAAGAFAAYQTITNDVWWKDNNGNPVMAQGGGISKFGGTYYWYGVQYVEMGPYYTNGTVNTGSSTFSSINCYSSTDLVHWTFQNKCVTRSTAGFSGAGWVGRLGQVVYNSASSQYVMWFEGLNGQACCTCATPTGNFVLNHVQPAITNVFFGPGAGDCTIFCDVDHGSTPYFICSDPHGRQHAYVCPLSSDFLTIGNAVAINDTGSIPAWPQGQEASNMFERNGVYYYTMSNLAGWSYSTAYEVNSTSIFSPTSYTADAAYLGTTADNTHYSQVSFGFQVAGTVATNYIMVGDRWAQFISTYAGAGHGSNFAIMCPITFTNNTPYFQSLNMFQIDTVTGKWRPATTADSPTNLTAAAGNAQAVLSWSAMDGATAYNVKRSTVNGGPYAIIASPTTANFTDNAVANGTTYYYVVSSTNVFGDSANSAEINVTPSIGPIISAASAIPNPVYPGQMVNISATVTAQANPIATVTVDVSAIGGLTNQTLVADGAGNFTNTITVGATTPVAVLTLTANASDTLGNIASPYPFPVTIGTVNDTWNGGGLNNNWSNSTNWVGGTAPGFGYSLIFGGVTRPTPVMDVSNNVYAVTFNNTASSFLITASGGSTLTLTGGVTNNSPNSQTLSVPVVLGAPVTVNAATAAVTLGQAVNNGGNLLTITDGGRPTVLAGIISGTGGLAKYGPGTNSLYANNTFTGGITISNGTLTVGSIPIGASGQLGAGSYSGAIADNGTLTFNSSVTQILLGVISGTGALNQIGSASLTLSAANTFGGPTTVSAGTLLLSDSLALQNSTLNFIGGKINPTGLSAVTLGGLSGTQSTVLINNSLAGVALTVGGNGSNTVYSGALSGSGVSLTKTGTGTLTLTGSNSYTGTTTVNAGTLELSAGGINGGALGGAGFLVDGGTLVSSGTTTFSALNNAFLESSGSATLGAITEPNSDGLLIKLTGGNFSASSLTLQRTAQFLTTPTATVPIAAATTSGLYVNGATANISLGTLTIGTGNSSDSVRLDAGNFVVTNEVLVGHTSNTRWEILQINGGSFTSLDTVNGIVLSQNNGTTPNNSELYLSGGTTTAGKIAFGTSTDTVGGTGFLIITNAALYLGGGGIVQPNTAGYISTISLLGGTLGAIADWSSALPLQLNGTSFTFQTADASGTAHNISLSGPLSGAGKLTKTGSGTLTLLGTNAYTGGTMVSAGKLLVNGSLAAGAVTITNGGVLGGTGVISGPVTINSGGMLAPGNPLGTLTISNTLLLAGGSISVQVQHSPLTNSTLKIPGILTNGGSLLVSGPVALAAGDTFKLFNAAGYSGTFTNVILPVLRVGLGWDTSQLNSGGIISVVVTATPVIGSVSISSGGLAFSGTGGVGTANFILLGTTNLGAPWSPLLTNQFDSGGNFNFTNTLGTTPQTFYRLQLQ